ncbi:conserved glutamic acid-rich protein [Phlyctema vagabunda]|uniref:Conserved glutamic acid-rich protein n=1 Tax=Phlyctema vagabunda TaxID=108571 RepID=A0ABR4P7R0_9HELO
MTDDDMEISSEHGHNAGDEDIDIDIDLTTGQVDDDYMLEDAQSNNAMENSFQQSPAMNDDLMLDEENLSYTMDDDTLNVVEDQAMEHETLPIPFTEIHGDASIVLDDHSFEGIPVDEESMQEAEATWDESADAGAITSQVADLEQVPTSYDVNDGVIQSSERVAETFDGSQPQQIKLQEPEDTEVITEELEQLEDQDGSSGAQDDTDSRLKSTSRSNSPQTLNDQPNSSPNGQINVEQSQDNNVSESKDSPEQLGEELEKQIDQLSNHDTASLFDNRSAGQESPSRHSHTETTELNLAQKVIVVYNSIEYSLFSGPDDDDPDSFFLSDTSIADKSIGDLFSAIREIIHEELLDGDELIMTIQELKIDIEETSSSNTAVTFQQILEAREKILQNDASGMSEPLFIILGKRKTLETKIAMLTTWGEEGRDLSNLRWDEDSEDNNDASEFAANDIDSASYHSNIESGDEDDHGVLESNGEVAEDHNSVMEQLAEVGGIEAYLSHHVEAEGDREPGTTEATASVELTARDDGTIPLSQESTSANPKGDDEDGDLIDYEDEDVEEVKPQEAVQKESHVIDAAAENKNDVDGKEEEDEYRETNDHEQPVEKEVGELVGKVAGHDETTPSGTDDKKDHIGQSVAESQEQNHEYAGTEVNIKEITSNEEEQDPEYTKLLAHTQDTTALTSVATEDHSENREREETGAAQLLAETDNEGGVQDYLDLEADIGNPDTSLQKEAIPKVNSDGVVDVATSESTTVTSVNTLDVDEINYDELEEDVAAEKDTASVSVPSNSELVDTLEASLQDEIDYDDDEEEHSPVPYTTATPVKQSTVTAPTNGNASTKRPRAEVELEDDIGTSSKEAKRVRS